MIYVVSGYMRCGTSMMMRALEAGGLEACYRQSREEMRKRHADEHYDPNVGGLYELEREDYQRPDFPLNYDGKLIKMLFGGIARVQPTKGMRVVFMRRDPEEIRQSYEAFFGTPLRGADKIDRQLDATIAQLNNRKDVASLHVLQYRNVVENPLKYFELLRENGWPIDIRKAAEAVDESLCRFKLEELTQGI